MSLPVEPVVTLAASPAFGGPATRPYRIVLLQKQDGAFVVHVKYLDDLGGHDCGDYFKPDEYGKAMLEWSKRSYAEVFARDSRCWVMVGL